jgi:hypothetical protein
MRQRERGATAEEYLRMMLLTRRSDMLGKFTAALGVYPSREMLDREAMFGRFDPKVISRHCVVNCLSRIMCMMVHVCMQLQFASTRPSIGRGRT